jgi:hypothetical protein
MDRQTFERETSIENMGETLFLRLTDKVKQGENEDAIAICEEWIVDGVDPQDQDYEWTFIENHYV